MFSRTSPIVPINRVNAAQSASLLSILLLLVAVMALPGCGDNDNPVTATGRPGSSQNDSQLVAGVWTEVNSGVTSQINDVIWSGDQFVAVGGNNGDGVIVTSPDGVEWTKRLDAPDVSLWGVACNDERIVAVGSRDVIYTSEDGITWTEASQSSFNCLFKVVWADTMFVAVGGFGGLCQGYVRTSTDGLNWSARNVVSPHLLRDITWSGSQFVAVGMAGTTIMSKDGIQWETHTIDSVTEIFGVVYGHDRYVAVGYHHLCTSSDGKDWQRTDKLTGCNLFDIDVVNGTFTIVGKTDIESSVWRSYDLTAYGRNGLPDVDRFLGSAEDPILERRVAVGTGGAIYVYQTPPAVPIGKVIAEN